MNEDNKEKVKQGVTQEEKKVDTSQENVVEKKEKKSLVPAFICIIIALVAIISVILLKPGSKANKNQANEEKIVTNRVNTNEYRMSGNSIEKFDLAFLKLENQEKNKVYSPLSIKYSLEMLAEGANGESRSQIDSVIGDYKSRKYENNANMSFANAMFIRDYFNDEIKDEYKDLLKEKYNAEVIVDAFESGDVVNNWVSDKTFNLIDKLVDDVSKKDFILVNALAIDMKWNYLIHCATGSDKNVPCYGLYDVTYDHEKVEGEDREYTHIEYPYVSENEFASIKFNGKENIKGAKVLASFNKYDAISTLGEEYIRNTVKNAYEEWLKSDNAQYYEKEKPEDVANRFLNDLKNNYGKATASTDFMLYDDENVKAFAKDLQTYNGITLQYVGIMPKNEKLINYVSNVNVEDINNIINNLKEMKIENFDEGYVTLIEGDIPMFKYDFELDFMEDLKKLGITDIFDDQKVDLGKMLKEKSGETIVEAKHKATIEFSNEGIKASAVSSEGGFGNTGDGFNYLFEVPTKRINLTFDNPYLYLIRDKDSGEVWFIGTVYEPTTK